MTIFSILATRLGVNNLPFPLNHSCRTQTHFSSNTVVSLVTVKKLTKVIHRYTSNRFTSFRLYEVHKFNLRANFRFTSSFLSQTDLVPVGEVMGN
jgi:hypothetical protein